MPILFSNFLHTSVEVLARVFLNHNHKKKHELIRESCSDETTRIKKHAGKRHVVHVFHGPSWSFPSTEYSWFRYQSTFLFETVLGNSSVNARRSRGPILCYHQQV